MKLICPSCGAVASAEAWENDTRWRKLLQVVTSLPVPLPPTVFGYLSLYRPGKSALSVKKALRLTGEIAVLVATVHIQVQGKVARSCRPDHWAAGMEQMTERRGSLSLPLKNHNYLRQIVWQLADEADRQQESATRNREMTGTYRQEPADGLSEVTRKYLQQQDEKDQV